MNHHNDPEVICLGQMVVDCITRNRRITSTRKNVYMADGIALFPGGDALNEAVVLSALGHKAALAGVVGDDHAGRLLMQVALDHGIDMNRVTVSKDVVTPIANLLVQENGERESINSPATKLADFRMDKNVVYGAKILSLASLFRAPLDRAEVVVSLIREAKKQDMIVCADTKLPTFRTMNASEIREVLPLIDYLFPNVNEASYMTGETSIQSMASALTRMGVKNVIIKAGPEGSFVHTSSGEYFQVEALAVEAIDSTGAGDNYVAGFLSGLLHGYDIERCCHCGTACAAVCVQSQGAATGIMDPDNKERVKGEIYG